MVAGDLVAVLLLEGFCAVWLADQHAGGVVAVGRAIPHGRICSRTA